MSGRFDASVGALEAAYGYDAEHGGKVLFKSTYSERPLTFRRTYQGALSHFIGTDCLALAGATDDQFPNTDSKFSDAGFALNNADGKTGWKNATVSPEFVFSTGGDNCHTALAQGQICFENEDGSGNACFDRSFALNRRESDSAVVISLHHSSATISEQGPEMICQKGSLEFPCTVNAGRKRNLRGN
jgi:hypothetical protein